MHAADRAKMDESVEVVPAAVVHFPGLKLRSVYAFHPNTILDLEHIALWLGVHPDTAAELPIKWLPLGTGPTRFRRRALASSVLAVFARDAR